jgi:hypothetical protein
MLKLVRPIRNTSIAYVIHESKQLNSVCTDLEFLLKNEIKPVLVNDQNHPNKDLLNYLGLPVLSSPEPDHDAFVITHMNICDFVYSGKNCAIGYSAMYDFALLIDSINTKEGTFRYVNTRRIFDDFKIKQNNKSVLENRGCDFTILFEDFVRYWFRDPKENNSTGNEPIKINTIPKGLKEISDTEKRISWKTYLDYKPQKIKKHLDKDVFKRFDLELYHFGNPFNGSNNNNTGK